MVVLDDGKVAFDGAMADGLLFYHRLLGTERGAVASAAARAAERGALEIAELELRDADGQPRGTRSAPASRCGCG